MKKGTHNKFHPKAITAAALFGALAIVFPILFHALSLGHVFMPMFIPIAVASFLLPLRLSLTLGVFVPVISSILTGMPPLIVPPIGILMIVELTTLAALNWLFFNKLKLPLMIAPIPAVIINRAIYLALVFVMAKALHLPQFTFSLYSIVKTTPGVVLLVTLVPISVLALRKYV